MLEYSNMVVSFVMRFWYFFKRCTKRVTASFDYVTLDVDLGESFEMSVFKSIDYLDDDIGDIVSIYSSY